MATIAKRRSGERPGAAGAILLLLLACAWPTRAQVFQQPPTPSAQKYPSPLQRLPSGSQSVGRPGLARIEGLNPAEANIGDVVQAHVSEKLSDKYSLLVEGVPVATSMGDDAFWIKFKVPESVGPVAKVTVKLIDQGEASTATLKILPIRILKVEPSSAARGERITLTLSPAGVTVGQAQLSFGPWSAAATSGPAEPTPTAPLQIVSSDTVNAIVPVRAPAGAIPLVVITTGQPSLPYNGFTVLSAFSWWYVPLGIGVMAGVIVMTLVVVRRARPREAVASQPSSVPAYEREAGVPEATFEVPPLDVPADLVDACVRGQCVLYAGAGLSARAGLPTWRPFVEGLLKWAEAEGLLDPSFARSLEQALERGGVDRVADSVVSAVRDRGATPKLQQHLSGMFGTRMTLPDVHRALPDVGFGAALTTNFDRLVEQAFIAGRTEDVPVYVPGDLDRLRSAFADRRFFVLKLYGALERPDSLVIAPAEYTERTQADKPFAEFVQQLFLSRTLLFLGASAAGIQAYLAPLRIRVSSQFRHYAVVAVEDSGWQADADLLERRYGIRVLPYVASASHPELLAFVNDLRKRIKSSQEVAHAQPQTRDDEQAAVLLKNVELRNIGPFENLELAFTRRWTVLLGDNGVGKSSVLRAIAAAVAGNAASLAGGRLLGSGQSEGHILLTTSTGERFGATVFRNSLGRPELSSEGASGLGGSPLVLAFPAIRTMAPGRTDGPELKELTQPPTPNDVLPALEALADPRILSFKKWLVNLDYAKSKGPEVERRVNVVLEALTRVLGILLRGMRLERIQVKDNDVIAQTDDGALPLDVLSQGTISVMGWAGVLVQRLHEVSETGDRPVLVLVDEIDAHMHPEWQQAIIARLVEAFPRVQFIVSTHSPFLAVGRRPGEIIRFRRDAVTKKVVAEVSDRDTTDMTVADALTSHLFGLQTPVAPHLQNDVLRMRDLSMKGTLTPDEIDEMRQLQARLDGVGVAATLADPLYGRFVVELSRQSAARIANLPPLSEKAQQRQRELTKQIAQEVLGTERPKSDERTA